ncbi:putative Meiosis arrest female protein 1 [Hypsibius exemplaris]|uniref:Meiosis arrest female protein 1 n=1 Tax=Hypsibius exemplaris TaxID=2072580 RepID=A0A1W0X239_HYPEX|nr:putative Meiosis arrest female protein 1 [Hypsibius exemplaris]
MGRGGRRRSSSGNEETDCPWEMPAVPQRPHQLPYSPIISKKGVDLYVLRMNREVNRQQMQRGLFRLLQQHVLIHHLSVEVDLFGSVNGHLVVPTRADIREVVKRFHRMNFYGRMLEFSESDPNAPIPVGYKKAVIRIFEEKKKTRLLLAELMRIFEEMYDLVLTAVDVMKMGDIVERYADAGTQMIRLLPAARVLRANLASLGCLEVLQLVQCTKECCRNSQVGHCSRYSSFKPMTCYRISIRDFAPRVRQLLRMHDGTMILSSFTVCYETHFGRLEEDETDGILLEQLLSSVHEVEFQQLPYQSRRIVLRSWTEMDEQQRFAGEREYPRFHDEIFHMLTLQRGCVLPFSEFVQTYRMVYDKTCRVADFGCTRLIDLMGLFSTTMHVLGTGNHRILTLTHNAQKRRFNNVLQQIRDQTGFHDSITAENFEAFFKFTFKEDFQPTEFGVCFVRDLLPVPQQPVIGQLVQVLRKSIPELLNVNQSSNQPAASISSVAGKSGVRTPHHETSPPRASAPLHDTVLAWASLADPHQGAIDEPHSSPASSGVDWEAPSDMSSGEALTAADTSISSAVASSVFPEVATGVCRPVAESPLLRGVISPRLALRFY